MNILKFILLGILAFSFQAFAFETVKVADDVYALVGDLGQRSEANLGHNMTSGFIITNEGVVVIDAGGSIADAKAIHQAIKKVTSKPVKWVINTGGQDHRWIGNSYFNKLGVTIIASEACMADMIERKDFQFSMAKKNIKDKFEDTAPVFPNKTFKTSYQLPIKDKQITLLYTGGGHTKGDIFVILKKQGIVFTGDIIFSQRLLGVQPNGGLHWIKTLAYLRDNIKPHIVIPGHGAVTNLKTALHDTYDYLLMLKNGVIEGFNNDAFDAFEAIQELDQSEFSYLKNYSNLSFRSKNALHMAQEIEALSQLKNN